MVHGENKPWRNIREKQDQNPLFLMLQSNIGATQTSKLWLSLTEIQSNEKKDRVKK